MKPFRIDTQLATIPANALVQLFQARRNARNTAPATCAASLFATAAALNEQINGGSIANVLATSDGLTTGLIPVTAGFLVTAVETNADDILSLPFAVGGKRIVIFADAACELSSDETGVKINNVLVDGANEALLVAGTLYTLVYNGVDNWTMTGTDALGVVETPRVPD